MSEPVAPTRTDPVARGWSERFGGPPGDHARPHRWLTPLRVVLAVAAVVCALGLVQRAPCLSTGWSDNTARYAKMCYSDVPYLYTGRGFAEQTWPYSESRYPTMEYPVGISYVAWAVSWAVVPLATGPPESVREQTPVAGLFSLPGMVRETDTYFLLTALVMALALLASTAFLAGVERRRPWDALLFAASPVLLLNAYINWDALAVVCVAGALWAWGRGRPGLTGVMIGLGAATKLYPLFLLGPLLVIAVRRRDPAPVVRAALAAALTWAVVNAPAVLTGLDQWKVFWRFNEDRGADLGSVWLLLANAGHVVGTDTINLVSWVFFAAACTGVLALGLAAPRTPRFAQLGLLVVIAFLLVNKVYSPQYVLWILPLAVAARPRWRDLLVWQGTELVYYAAVWLYLGQYTVSGTSGAPDPAYQVAIVLRLLGELYLAAVVVRDVLRPEHDPVRNPPRLAPEPDERRPAWSGVNGSGG